MIDSMNLPILYSLRHCPFAMRARLALYKSGLEVELRDVKLDNKPPAMLLASPKGTVPILVLPNDIVLDESLEVMLWSLASNDPENLLLASDDDTAPINQRQNQIDALLKFIHPYDANFKGCLERYKCAKRYHESNLIECRQACEVYIQDLEARLSKHKYVFGEQESLADIAILPFIRQFAKVERRWYVSSTYSHVKRWLNDYLQTAMFNKVMADGPIWEQGKEALIFNKK